VVESFLDLDFLETGLVRMGSFMRPYTVVYASLLSQKVIPHTAFYLELSVI